MNRSLLLFVVGFLTGAPVFCYLELKSDTPAAASDEPAVAKPVAQVPPPKSQPEREPSAPAGRPQQETSNPVTPTPGPRRTIDSQPAEGSPGGGDRSKDKHAVRTPKIDRSKPNNGGNNASQERVSESSARPVPEAPASGAPPADRDRGCQIRLTRILVGEEVVTNRVLPVSTLDQLAKYGKYVIYFEISISSQAQRRHLKVGFRDFRLEDSAGLIYSPLRTSDCLSAKLEPGQTARGGVAFALYNDGAPARLLFRTGNDSFTPLPESLFWDGEGEDIASP